MLLPTQDKEARLTDKELRQATDEYRKQTGDTSYLDYEDLKPIIIDAQIAKLEKLGYHKGLPTSIEEALNSGDGAYRP